VKILTMEQGSPQWIVARIGIPTASQFHRIMTPERLDYSKAAEGYVCELLAELTLNASLDDSWTTAYMERGQELEGEARSWYELTRDVSVRQVGFVFRDDGRVGCSPDGLVEPNGGIEIKCLSANRHIEMVVGGFPAKMTQVQGNIWLCEREWWDVIAYNPGMPKAVIRVWRDENYIKALAKCVARFLDTLDKAKAKLTEIGPSAFREIRPKDPKDTTAAVEPDPNAMTLDDIDALRLDLAEARRIGVLYDTHEARVLKWAKEGDWLQARMAWTAVKNALAHPERYSPLPEGLGVVP